jgi:hypothetical protein
MQRQSTTVSSRTTSEDRGPKAPAVLLQALWLRAQRCLRAIYNLMYGWEGTQGKKSVFTQQKMWISMAAFQKRLEQDDKAVVNVKNT